MDVFLSWSGERSRYLAECFKEWLPNVLQFVEPYFSQQDIRLGDRWSNNIEENLNVQDFGLVFITPENIDSTWVNFEAGALSKNLKSRLIPMLWDARLTLLDEGPLKQFQSAKEFDEENIHELIIELNNNESEDRKLTSERASKSFDKWWPDLEEKLAKVPELNEDIEKPTEEELLESLIRQLSKNNRLLEANPVDKRRTSRIHPRVTKDLTEAGVLIENAILQLQSFIEENHLENTSDIADVIEILYQINGLVEAPTRYITRRFKS